MTAFLQHPNEPGAMGALMDEYARAAGDLCGVVEQVPLDRFRRARPSVGAGGADSHTESIQAICEHVAYAVRIYSDYIRAARGLTKDEPAGELAVPTPADLRPLLVDGLRYTEGALDGLYEVDDDAIAAIQFEVRWGPTFDPDMLLEHAICHLLRHRRQILRWS